MDFMKWLNSLGDLLYEVMSWLIFYPVTLWRTTTSPLATMGYADKELHDSDEQQFTDTLNPPLFLVLSLLLTQAIDVALGGGVNPIITQKNGLAEFVTDDTTLLVLRLVLFSLFPLMMATRLLRAKRVKVTRQRLRSPFYAQCYACAPFALFLGTGVSLGHTTIPWAGILGAIFAVGAIVVYLTTETLWFSAQLKQGYGWGLLNAVRAFVQATIAFLVLGALVLAH
jgi:hypothetical protein